MSQTITPEKQSVESCLKQKSYYIDFYQREYVWNKDTVEILLKDIFYSFDQSYPLHKDEDISPSVIDQFNWYYLNVFITNNIDGKVYIVDGQQRLTTLTLIATKLYHDTKNENLRDILKECIFAKDKYAGNVFCIDHEKRKNVMQSILDGKTYTDPIINKTEQNLLERYKDIEKFIDSKTMDERKLNCFICFFLARLVIVELSITQDDTPMVFEVINDRGEALKPFEILKGKMIGLLPKGETDDYSKKWDSYMASLYGIEDDFFIDLIKSKYIFKRNSTTEGIINNAYHRYIFDFNDISDNLCFRRQDKDHIKNIKHFIDNDMKYYSQLYAKIRKNNNKYLIYDNVINSLSGQYQNILAACSINDAEENLKIEAVAKEFDRLWMLLNLNGLYDSNELQEISYELNHQLNGANLNDYRKIFNGIILKTIKDRRTLKEVNTVLDYGSFLKKNYTNMKSGSLRYFLARIEFFICEEINQKMQNDVEYISTKTGNKTGYHIEHILSNNDTNKKYFASEEDFNNDRNLMGGLLLLKGLDNISSGNEEYKDKLKTYGNGLVWGHSLCPDFYHSNKNFDAFIQKFKQITGLEIHPITTFDRNALLERTKIIYELVKMIWEVE